MSDDVFPDDLDFEVSAGAVADAEEAYAGNFVSKPGMYHVIVSPNSVEKFGVDEDGRPLDDKLCGIKLTLQVLAGSDDKLRPLDDQVDKFLTHRLFLESWETKPNKDEGIDGVKGPIGEDSAKSLRVFAYAFGVISEADLAKPNVKIPFGKLSGKQAIVRVQEDKFNGRIDYKVKWNNDAWPLTHEKVKDVKKLGTVASSGKMEKALEDEFADI